MRKAPKAASRGGSARAIHRGVAASLAAIVAWAALARAAGLFGPFGRGWQNLGAIYGILARNDLRYGFVATHFAGVLNPGPAAPSEWSYYMHHPPGFAWLLAGSRTNFELLDRRDRSIFCPSFSTLSCVHRSSGVPGGAGRLPAARTISGRLPSGSGLAFRERYICWSSSAR